MGGFAPELGLKVLKPKQKAIFYIRSLCKSDVADITICNNVCFFDMPLFSRIGQSLETVETVNHIL